ncbi:MAG: AtpZ/AtpI family protein [Planctomycetaceae bacterium]
MPRPRHHGQSGVAVGMYWATRISSVGFSMAIPPLIGFWLDGKWGTRPWLVIAGACVGFTIAMLEFAKLIKQQTPESKSSPPRSPGKSA